MLLGNQDFDRYKKKVLEMRISGGNSSFAREIGTIGWWSSLLECGPRCPTVAQQVTALKRL